MSHWVRLVTNRRAGICFLRLTEVPPCLTEVPQPATTLLCHSDHALSKILKSRCFFEVKVSVVACSGLWPPFPRDWSKHASSDARAAPATFSSAVGAAIGGTSRAPSSSLGTPLCYLNQSYWPRRPSPWRPLTYSLIPSAKSS